MHATQVTEANVNQFLSALAAQPKTHKVVSTYACGKVHVFEARNERSAESYADTVARPKMDRDLIDRESGANVRVISVEVLPI